MKNLRVFWVIVLIVLLTSCSSNEDTKPEKNVDFQKISTHLFDQTVSNQAKETLSQFNDITSINAINTNKKLFVAFEIKHSRRFQLDAIRQDVQSALDKKFPDYKVDTSTDQKLVLETDKLEDKIKNRNISQKKLKDSIDHLIKLMNEKT